MFFSKRELPVFNGYELGLLGISSATYLAIKTKENKPAVREAENGNIE